MATIKEYLKYYKELSFEECNFNINDVILFTELSYIKWKDIVPNDKNKITLEEAGKLFFNKKQVDMTAFMNSNIDNMKTMMNSRRYKNICLGNYRSVINDDKQFGGLCIYFEPGKVFVSYEGTDGSVVGWKEDFVLGYHFPIDSQKSAIRYINEVITRKDKVIYIGGHSKGGNLAMTAGLYARNDIFKRVGAIFNLDGPGFREKDYNTDEFKRILPKLIKYIPEESVIGMLLYSTSDYKVVKSNYNGIMQHDCNSWQCFGSFLEEGKLSKMSARIDKKIKAWNKKYSDDELETMILTFFSILEDNNIKDFNELKSLKWNQITSIFNKVKNIDEKTKKLYLEALKELIWNKDDKVLSIKIKKEGK